MSYSLRRLGLKSKVQLLSIYGLKVAQFQWDMMILVYFLKCVLYLQCCGGLCECKINPYYSTTFDSFSANLCIDRKLL